ncbi:MAG: MarR family transcriptional regulator [Eubacterium sp.]|nr:MarR family transcriptional regulator [Eubacterium sp.]
MDELETLRILNETINRKMGLPRTFVGGRDLAATDLVVLYALLTEDRPLTQSEIARFLFRSRQSINSSLQKMRQQGLLKLIPGEGKKKRILLTQKGKDITREYVTPVFQMELHALSCLSPEERDSLAGLLIKFGNALTRESDAIQASHTAHADRKKEEFTNGTDSDCE